MAFFDRTAANCSHAAGASDNPTNYSINRSGTPATTAFFDRTAGNWILWNGTAWVTQAIPPPASWGSADTPTTDPTQAPERVPEPLVVQPSAQSPRDNFSARDCWAEGAAQPHIQDSFKCDICGHSFRSREVQPTKALFTIAEPNGTIRQFTDERLVCTPCVWKEFKVFSPSTQ